MSLRYPGLFPGFIPGSAEYPGRGSTLAAISVPVVTLGPLLIADGLVCSEDLECTDGGDVVVL